MSFLKLNAHLTGKISSHAPIPEYSFIDQKIIHLPKEQFFYRIKQIDIDGQFAYSILMFEKSKMLGLEGIIFPNPSSGTFWYRYQGEIKTAIKMELCTIEGKSIWQKTFDSTTLTADIPLPFHNLSSGIYLLRVSSDGARKIWGVRQISFF